jgi:hypothetical protein
MHNFSISCIRKKQYKMSKVPALNVKDVATRMSTHILGEIMKQATGEVASKMLEVAKSWGATIPKSEESAFVLQIQELFVQPQQWPAIEVVQTENSTVTRVTTNAKAPAAKGKKKASDKAPTNTKKASDYRAIGNIPAGVEIPTCPAIMKGERKGEACGRECKRVLDEHDPSEPRCAALQCNHLFCGTHVAAAGKASGGGMKSSAEDPEAKPVTYTSGGATTTVETTEVNQATVTEQAAASKAVLASLMNKMKKNKEKQDKEDE